LLEYMDADIFKADKVRRNFVRVPVCRQAGFYTFATDYA
jgi:hypothetical protein